MHIITTTDLSESSKAGVFHAFELAKRFDGRVTVLFVLENPPIYPLAERIYHVNQEVDRKRIQKNIQHWLGEQTTPYAVEVIDGISVPGEIAAFVEDQKPAYLVMSSAGHSDLGSLFIGSVTHRVINKVSVPVILVKGKA